MRPGTKLIVAGIAGIATLLPSPPGEDVNVFVNGAICTVPRGDVSPVEGTVNPTHHHERPAEGNVVRHG